MQLADLQNQVFTYLNHLDKNIKYVTYIIINNHFLILGDSLSTVEVYNPLTERWELAEAMSILRSRVGVAVLNNKLYAFGGYNGIERLSSVEVFDPATKSWNIVSPMHRKRRSVILIFLTVKINMRFPKIDFYTVFVQFLHTLKYCLKLKLYYF